MDLSNKATVERLIADRHWGRGESVRSIERELGIGKTVLSNWCKRHGLAVRSRNGQVGISNRLPSAVAKRSGVNHWSYGRPRPDSSDRMTANNPMGSTATRNKAAHSRARGWRSSPSSGEALMRDWLARCQAEFAMQYVVGSYIIDFAFPRRLVGLEVDGKSHDRPSRKLHDIPRDQWLIERGWKIIRVRQERLARPAKLLRVLKEHVPDLQLPSDLPAVRREYRVLIRDAQSPAGRQV